MNLCNVVGLAPDRLALSYVEKGEIITITLDGKKLPLVLFSNDLVPVKTTKFIMDKITPWLGDCTAQAVLLYPEQVQVKVEYKALNKEVTQYWSVGALATVYNFGGDAALEQYVKTEVDNILNKYTGRF